jgi:hypothetical protein
MIGAPRPFLGSYGHQPWTLLRIVGLFVTDLAKLRLARAGMKKPR